MPTLPRRLLLTGVALCTLAGLAGCGAPTRPSGAAHPPAASTSTTPARSASRPTRPARHAKRATHNAKRSSETAKRTTAVTLPRGVSNDTHVPSQVPNRVALRKDVALTTCAKAPGGWRAAGTATNPGHGPADYTITVFFTTSSDTVIGTGATHLHVSAGRQAPWKVTGRFTPAPATGCVLRGVG